MATEKIENINNISVNGDNNIVVQGIADSTITINVGDQAKIQAFFDAHKAQINTILELLKGRQEPVLKQFGEQIYNIQTIGTANFNQAVLRGCTIQAGKVDFYVDNEALVQAFFQASNEPLRILVITETAGAMQNILPPKEFDEVATNYSFALEYWRPFAGEKDITDLLKEFQEKTGYQLEVGFVGVHTWHEHYTENGKIALEDCCHHTILIADSFALAYEPNKDLAKIFDDLKVGGCLVPIPQNLPTDIAQYAQARKTDVFSKLSERIANYPDHLRNFVKGKEPIQGLLQVELEVHSKADFFRRLANIAHYKLGLTPLKSIPNTLDKYFKDASTSSKDL